MKTDLYIPLDEADAVIGVLVPQALWNKDKDFAKGWDIMENELANELKNAKRDSCIS